MSVSTGEMSKRYGMIYVDKEDNKNHSLMKRIKKDSFEWYKKLYRAMVNCYLEIINTFFMSRGKKMDVEKIKKFERFILALEKIIFLIMIEFFTKIV